MKTKEWEKDFADNLMYKWGGLLRAKEKEADALMWVRSLLVVVRAKEKAKIIREIRKGFDRYKCDLPEYAKGESFVKVKELDKILAKLEDNLKD